MIIPRTGKLKNRSKNTNTDKIFFLFLVNFIKNSKIPAYYLFIMRLLIHN